MKKRALFASVILCSIAFAGDSARATDAQATSPPRQIDKLEWLVGGTWTADASKLPGGLARIETRYDTAAGGAVIRFTTRFLDSANDVENSYAGDLFFDPTANSLSMWYIDSRSAIVQGPITVDADNWSASFRAPGDIVGKKETIDFRCDIMREGPNKYKWTLSARPDTAWTKILELEYIRS
jgi:hypothetical protein